MTIDEIDELRDWYAEDEQVEATTWEAIDLGPWLSGDITSPQPTVGISRSDGQKLLYAGREHTVFGETEAGKSWFALECCATEIRMGRDVVYIHYEEGDPASTIERLRLLAVTPAQIAKHLRFAAPMRPARAGWLADLLYPAPTLVIHDGMNEAMSLHGDDTNNTDGAATFRRNIIKPCLAVGAATLACDHVTKNGGDNRGRYAIGAAHKVNAIDGAAFLMENLEPFGRGLRGASNVYVTKDRPGQLRATAKPTGIPGKTFIGVLSVDATPDAGPEFLNLWAPKDRDDAEPLVLPAVDLDAELADAVYDVLWALDNHQVDSFRSLFRAMRKAGHVARDERVRNAVVDLVQAKRAVRIVKGKSMVIQALDSASQGSSDQSLPVTASATASPIGGDASDAVGSSVRPAASDAVGRSGTQTGAAHRQAAQ